MKKQRNKFLTFLLALCPGAAHMYMGFMVRGLSFMAFTCLIAAAAIMLDSAVILFIFPLIWFYAFFDALNLNGMGAEQFQNQTDESFHTYLMQNGKSISLQNSKYSVIFGVIIIIAGAVILLSNILPLFYGVLPDELIEKIQRAFLLSPRLLIGMIILWLGIKLIVGKRKETANDEK